MVKHEGWIRKAMLALFLAIVAVGCSSAGGAAADAAPPEAEKQATGEVCTRLETTYEIVQGTRQVPYRYACGQYPNGNIRYCTGTRNKAASRRVAVNRLERYDCGSGERLGQSPVG